MAEFRINADRGHVSRRGHGWTMIFLKAGSAEPINAKKEAGT